MELRGKRGMVLQSWEPDHVALTRETRVLVLESEMSVSVEHVEIVAVAACGKLRKLALI